MIVRTADPEQSVNTVLAKLFLMSVSSEALSFVLWMETAAYDQ